MVGQREIQGELRIFRLAKLGLPPEMLLGAQESVWRKLLKGIGVLVE
jgi:hypothetical protein